MSTPPATDAMIFYDNYEAPLSAGSYRFVLQQTVNLEGDEDRHYYQDQRFEVLAPRYAIDAEEIQAYFPPNGGVADYTNVLPHLVLLSRNLPWERILSPQREPWLALLMLSDQDLAEGQVVLQNGTVADLAPHRPDDLPADESVPGPWLRPDGGGGTVLLPKFKRTEDLNTPVRLLDLDLKLFRKLCPTRKELPLLAHIRHVDTADKVPLEMIADGEFSVLVANRFPSPGTNTVYLISLEGWNELFDSDPNQQQPPARVRLITLGGWTFVNDKSGHDTFGGLMQQLKKNAAVFSIALPGTSGHAHVDNALKRGYVPLDYKPLQSTPTLAFYRGPLAPSPKQPMKRPAFERADAALIFDDKTGMMDVSYASAWELGRLLALSSPAFAKGLHLFVERSKNAAEFTKEIERFLEDHRSSFKDPATVGRTPPNEKVRITDDLVQWIGRLVLLYPVPFHYLVPHTALLPPESLRFFHLDDNWVNAMVDGALSTAVRTTAQHASSRAELQSVLSKIVYQYRLRLQGKQPEWSPSEQYMETPKTGFLLRSSLVSGWPGVEVTAASNAPADPNLPKILRFDQISEGVLFCLARGSLETVTFREPREGITFGLSSDGKLKATKSGKVLDVKKDLLKTDPPAGVVDIAKLRDHLGCSGSAELATEMIRKPEQQDINWKRA